MKEKFKYKSRITAKFTVYGNNANEIYNEAMEVKELNNEKFDNDFEIINFSNLNGTEINIVEKKWKLIRSIN